MIVRHALFSYLISTYCSSFLIDAGKTMPVNIDKYKNLLEYALFIAN